LCYTYKYCKDKILPSNIYGCDIEKDTIKFGVASLMITTNEYNENIIRCNSLIENPYLFSNKKFDIVFTNPPFGTKNNYKDLKENFESYKKLNYKDSILKFEDIYPFNTNKGTNLFIQLVVYLLKENGICAIVLPDGELMSSNNNSNIEIRKFILDKCKILKIINVEGGSFTNTGIKTKVLIFQKGDFDNYNQEVEFVEINSNGIDSLGLEKLNSTFQFNISKKEEVINYNKDIEIKTLDEVCEFCTKSQRLASYGKKEGIYPFITSSQEITKYCDEPDYKDDNYIIIGTGGNPNIHYQHNFSCSGDCIVLKSTKYIYYYLLNNINILEEGFKGATIKHISKEYIKNIKIPIPSLEQQKEIVEYLDILNKNTKSSNDKIEEIKKLNKNYLKLNLKYNKKIEIKTLGEVCEFLNGKRRNANEAINNGIYKFITCSIQGYSYLNEYDFEDKALIINSINGSGKCMIYCADKYSTTNNNIHFKVKHIEQNLTEYIYYYLFNNIKILEDGFNGSNQKKISKEYLENILIPIPSLEQQKVIVEYLDFNNNLIDNLNKEIKNNKKQGEIFFNMFLSD